MAQSRYVCSYVAKERTRCKGLILKTNGTLEKYTLMVYWSRPAVGIKENAEGKQAVLFKIDFRM